MATSVPTLDYWAPLICLIAFVILIAITYLFRTRGNKKYKKGTVQTEIFLSGEEPPSTGQRHVRAYNMYWGFFQALKRYYDPTMRTHSGIINDYIIWLIALMSITGVILFIVWLT